MKPEKIMILAGETSGDLHAANLAKELFKINPGLAIFGMGGQNMSQAGVEIVRDIKGLGVIGIIEVLKNLGLFKKLYKDLVETLKKEKPDAVILVDYPGFNLRFAKAVKELGIPVIYYISPQIWAWKKNRIIKIRQLVDLMLVIFPFEEDIYKKANVPVEFVGHPLMDVPVPDDKVGKEVRKTLGYNDVVPIIGFLPGSRDREIDKLFPTMLESIAMIKKQIPDAQFIVSKAPEISEGKIKQHLNNIEMPVFTGEVRDLMKACDVVVSSSGTAVLEAAIVGTPVVVVYKLATWSWVLGMMLIDLPFISLVNILANKQVVPELIQEEFNPANVAEEVLSMYSRKDKVKEELFKVTQKLGSPGASANAAKTILNFF